MSVIHRKETEAGPEASVKLRFSQPVSCSSLFGDKFKFRRQEIELGEGQC